LFFVAPKFGVKYTECFGEEMKVLIINGSHRKGNTGILVGKLEEDLVDKVDEVRVLVLRDIEMKLPDGCEACAESEICPNINDQFSEEVEPTIRDYDVYIIATPTWSDNVAPLIKIFWDRIVSWCHKDRMYLKGKKLAVATHGMAGEKSWSKVIDWVRGVCEWEGCEFAGSLTFESGAGVGSIKLDETRIEGFVEKLLTF
jgi:multimeric flavodoxin WrbA